jgi:hypothetical protein
LTQLRNYTMVRLASLILLSLILPLQACNFSGIRLDVVPKDHYIIKGIATY